MLVSVLVLFSFFSVDASSPFPETKAPVFSGLGGFNILPSSAGQKTKSSCGWQLTIHIIRTTDLPDAGGFGVGLFRHTSFDLVSLAAVFSIVTQRSSPQTAAHIRTTFLSTTFTNHHVVYIFRELGAPT